MKSKPNLFARASITLAAFVVLAMVQSVQATPYLWIQDSAATQTWTTTGNWSGGSVFADGTANELKFFSDITTALANGTNSIITSVPATGTMNILTLNGKGAAATGASNIIIGTSATTWTLDGTTPTVNLNGVNGSQALNYTIATNLTLSQASTAFTGDGSAGFKFTGLISGSSNAITKSGTSTLTLSNGSNTYGGGTTLSAGTLALGASSTSTSGTVTSGPVGTGTLTLSGGTLSNSATVILGNAINISSSTSTSVKASSSGNVTLTGALTGTGTFNANGTVSGSVVSQGDISGFTGTFGFVDNLNGNNLTFNGSTAASQNGSGAKYSLSGATSGTNLRALSGGTIANPFQMGELSGTGGVLQPNYNLAGTVTIQIGALNTTPAAFSGVMADSGTSILALKKVGSGTLTLSGANTYTGGTTISNGKIAATGANALGTGSVTNNATLDLTGGGVTYTGLSTGLSGSGIVNVTLATGTGTTILNGDYSSFTGTWNIGVGAAAAAGKVQMNGLDNASATINVLANGTLYVSSAVTKNASLVLNGGDTGESLGQLRIEGGANWAGNITLAGNITGTNDFTMGGNSGSAIISGNIGETGGPRALIKGGGSSLTLSGNNTYTGATTVSAGTLKLGSAGALGNGTLNTSGVTVGGSAIFDLAGITTTATVPLTLNSSASGNDVGSFYNTGAASVTIGGTVTLGADTRVGAGNILLNNTLTGNSKILLKDGVGTLELSNSGTVALASLGANRGTIQVDAGTTLNVTGISIGTGNGVGSGLTLNGGAVTSSSVSAATFASSTNSGASGTLTLNSGTLTVFGLIKGGTAVATFNANFNGGTLKATADNAAYFTGANSAKVQAGGALIDDGGNAITIAQALTHDSALVATSDGGLTKSGAGSLTLSGPNTYTGATTISEGTLKVGNASALGFGGLQSTATNGTTVSSGYTLDLNGTTGVNEPIILNGTGIGGNGALINNSGTTATIGNGIAGATFSSGGSGYSAVPTIAISGTGTGASATASLGLTTASVATATGGTGWVTGDTVNVTGGGGSGAIGTVTASGGAITSITITTAGSGYTTAPTGMSKLSSVAGAGTLTLTGNATNFTVSGIAMTAAGSGYTGTPTYTFSGGSATSSALTLSSVTLASNSSIGGSGNINISAVVGESTVGRSLTKVGAGTLTLGAANTYTGTTTVSSGTLAIGSGGSIANTSQIILGANTTLDVSAASGFSVGASTAQTLKGTGAVTGDITVGGSGTLAIGNSPGTMVFNNNLTLALGSVSNFEINGFGSGQYDLAVSGSGPQAVSLGGTLNLLFSTGFNTNGSVKIFDFENYSGGFGSVVSTGLATGYTASFDSATGLVTVVPEPASALLGSLGVLCLLRRRRVG